MRYYRDPGNVAIYPRRKARTRTRTHGTKMPCPCCRRGDLRLLYAAYPGARVASLRCYVCGCEWGLNPSFLGAHLRVGARCNGRRT